MKRAKPCSEVSPQCPDGQEDGYKLGWYHGQIAAVDGYRGDPGEYMRLTRKVQQLESALYGDTLLPGYSMTKQEWTVFMALRRGGVKSREQLMSAAASCSRGGVVGPRQVAVLICGIRKKLPREVGEIKTVSRSGWLFLPTSRLGRDVPASLPGSPAII